MAAFIALGKTLTEPALGIIASFLKVRSPAATCGTGATDIGAMADADIMAHHSSYTHTVDFLYSESLELPSEWVGDVSLLEM